MSGSAEEKPNPKDFLFPVTKRYLKGKKDGKLYPVDADENMLKHAIACQGGHRKCTGCQEYFTTMAAIYAACPSCRDRMEVKAFLDAPIEKPGSVIYSLVSGDYGYSLEDFEELAEDLEPGLDVCDDATVWLCRLVNPSPNRLRCLDWDDITAELQPGNGDYVEPSNAVAAAIKVLNEALEKEPPISYGPHWETRLPISEEFLKQEGIV